MVLNFARRIIRPSITNEREIIAYVLSVTAPCIAIALAVDVPNQLIFFIDWATCLRNWAIDVILVPALAVPISHMFGRANLELYRAKLLADELGRTDQLTGLPNRRALMTAVHAATSDALSLVIVDIDRFKRVNDEHGHLAGDEVIRAVSRIMSEDLGALGQIARVGGEEFALLSSGLSAEFLAARLMAFRDRVGSTPTVVNGVAIRVTISAGAALRRGSETFDQLYSAADRALYAAKTSGRNRVVVFPAARAPRFGDGVEPFESGPDQFALSA